MRKVFVPVANSVDNYIAAKDGGVEWLRDSPEIEAMLTEVFAKVDTVVMGRITYQFAASHGMEAYPNAENYVFSSTLNPADYDKVTIVSGDTAAFVRGLKEKDGGDICVMGGAGIIRQCLRHGLIDELHLNLHPLLLGGGAPLFLPLEEPVELELLECRAVPHGCVALSYRVVH